MDFWRKVANCFSYLFLLERRLLITESSVHAIELKTWKTDIAKKIETDDTKSPIESIKTHIFRLLENNNFIVKMKLKYLFYSSIL